MAQDLFGGAHTEKKLEKLTAYLTAYATALKKQRFKTIFFDAFAGTGAIPVATEDGLFEQPDRLPFIEGSAVRAFSVEPCFDEYIFVEKDKRKFLSLCGLRDRFPHHGQRMYFQNNDANQALATFCRVRDWQKCRAVVFLDPFGNQVEWSTIEAIAATEAIDLWYLFPAGLGVHRQIGSDGRVHETHGASLDRLFGPHDWRSRFLARQQDRDLFGDSTRDSKIATPNLITEFMIECMTGRFRGGVLPEWLPLGSRGVHMYSLIFACANPSPRAAELARKLARAVLRSEKRGRPKRH